MVPLSLSDLTKHISNVLESDPQLRNLWIEAEVASWKRAASGHVYFSLKDVGASINGVMWRSSAVAHTWLPRVGDQVLVHGYVAVYAERGVYQLYANRVQPAGRGQLYAEFEALKMRLNELGLFDEERKRTVVSMPARIGVITSANAAALRDVLHVLALRWPQVSTVLFPTLVQGADAPRQIVAALEAANRYSAAQAPIDTLLLVRGGGSMEDLWAFNDAGVAHAIASSKISVIAGIGHETDFTIADFVADLRAPTPSAAAAAAVPDQYEMIDRLLAIQSNLQRRVEEHLSAMQQTLQAQSNRLVRVHPQRQLDRYRQQLDERTRHLHAHVQRLLTQRQEHVRAADMHLIALDPKRVLRRGYSIVQHEVNGVTGQIVRGPEELSTGDRLLVQGADGAYSVETV